MRTVQSVAVVAALMQSCVCLQPVDETPEVDGGRDAAVESPVTSFVAPVPVGDLAEAEWIFWRLPPSGEPLNRLWRSISWTTEGEFLVDAVGGVMFQDAGYHSAATDEWRQSSRDSTNTFPRWTNWNGDWYRYIYPSDPQSTSFGPLRLFRLNRTSTQLELTLTTTSTYDGSFGAPPQVSATTVWGGSRWWVFDREWIQDHYEHGQVFITSSLDTLAATPSIDWRILMTTDGVDGDSRLIWGQDYSSATGTETLAIFRGADLTTTAIDAGACFAPFLRGSAPITMGCLSDGGVDVWVADRDGARIIGRDALPPELRSATRPPFLARLQPLRWLFQRPTDAGTSAMLNICDSDHCAEVLETYSAPLNAGVDDAGALYVADYVLDAGVRVTRFAPGAW